MYARTIGGPLAGHFFPTHGRGVSKNLGKRSVQAAHDPSQPWRAQPAAQTLFMLLPLVGLWLMREGKPMWLTPTKCLAVGAAIVAFSLLVAMFYDTEIGVPN